MSDELWTVKAVEGDEWALDVLGNPYGGHANGKDAQGEYFSADTKFREDVFGLPPVVYYHGMTPEGQPDGAPAYIGRTVKRWVDAAGVWYRVVLDKASEYAGRVWDAAKQGVARASSGSAPHLVRVEPDGRIREWPVVELSVFDAIGSRQPANRYAVAVPAAKAVYEAAGLDTQVLEPEPEAQPEAAKAAADAEPERDSRDDSQGEKAMDEQDVRKIAAEAVADALKADREAQEAKAKAQAERQAELDAAVKAEREKWEADAAKSRRLPFGNQAPHVNKFNDSKYDNLSGDDLAWMVATLDAAAKRANGERASEGARQSLALKMQSAADKGDTVAASCVKALYNAAGRALKADEIMQQDLANYGDDWVGVAYSNRMWENIRKATFVLDKIPQIEVPAGHESLVIPLESGDPTFYKVAEVEDFEATNLMPVPTVTASQMGTAKQTLTLAKMGARTMFSGELNEDSLVPFISQLRSQMERAGAETLEHVLIDGDTDVTASTNINDIAGEPAGTEAFLLANGFRKLALVTNTANSRSAGVLTVEDYIATMQLLGVAGKNADRQRCAFIIDPNTYWKTMELTEVKTRDVFVQPTLEGGQLVSLYGYPVYPSWNMHKASAVLKAQAADGKIDLDTTADNVAGAILAVRWDQWLFGWRRRMTLETTRIANADATELVALCRFGLTYRDTEAAAESYGVTL